MGFFDKKTTKSTTNYETNTDNSFTTADNSVTGDASTVNKVTAESITGDVVLTDHGAIEQATNLSKGALDFSSNVLANAFTFGDSANNRALLFGENALELAKTTSILNKEFGMDALDKITEATNNSLNFGQSALDSVGKSTSEAVSKIADVVKGANTSDSVQTIKYIALAVAVVVGLIFVAPLLVKNGD